MCRAEVNLNQANTLWLYELMSWSGDEILRDLRVLHKSGSLDADVFDGVTMLLPYQLEAQESKGP